MSVFSKKKMTHPLTHLAFGWALDLQTFEPILPQGLIYHYGNGIGKIQGPGVIHHGNPDTAVMVRL
jgi:hypothetical protein